MVYDTQITIVNGIYKPTYNWWAPHCTPLETMLDVGDFNTFAIEHLGGVWYNRGIGLLYRSQLWLGNSEQWTGGLVRWENHRTSIAAARSWWHREFFAFEGLWRYFMVIQIYSNHH